MRLTDLEPEWVEYVAPGSRRRPEDLTIDTAHGVMFLDPVGFAQNGGNVGTCSVLVWFRDRGVPPEEPPGPGRWGVSGTGFHDLTLTPSVDLSMGGQHPERWHGFVTNGEVT